MRFAHSTVSSEALGVPVLPSVHQPPSVSRLVRSRWHAASELASDTATDWLTRDEYDEKGPSAMARIWGAHLEAMAAAPLAGPSGMTPQQREGCHHPGGVGGTAGEQG